MLLSSIQHPLFLFAVEIAVMTGLRRSEICGLKWENIDFAKSQIRVLTQLKKEDRVWNAAGIEPTIGVHMGSKLELDSATETRISGLCWWAYTCQIRTFFYWIKRLAYLLRS